ncbi:MFS transporter [Curtobacterium flaccumfaciens]|uniref:MFS transporter n=1 Tax=Curtobacterium flaccumfaciens TaxID=2035 RepID=UPI003994FBA8
MSNQRTLNRRRSSNEDTLSAATRRRAFIGMGWVSVAFVSASAAPSPLYVLYQEHWHFASYLLSVAFSVYAFTLLIALLFAGSLSDYLGRRPVLAAAIIAELVAMTMLLLATNVAHVLIARAIQGFATGVATATVSAALADLSPAHNKQLGATIGSITPLAGLAVGSGAAGFIVQATQQPIHVVFTAILVVLVIGMVFVITAPETIRRQPGALASLTPQLRVPPAARSAFVASSFLNIAVWLTTSLALGLIPQINREVFHVASGVANGGIIALLTGIGAVAVVLSRKLPPSSSTLVAAVTLAAGALAQAVGVLTDDLILFVIGSAIAGIGVGVGFGGYIRLVIQTAAAHDRAAVFSAMYVVSYLTFGIPVIIAGVLLGFAPAPAVAACFCALTVASSVLGLIAVRRFTRKVSA